MADEAMETQEPVAEPVEPVAESDAGSGSSDSIPPDGVALDSDGELHLGENFLGDLGSDEESEPEPVQFYTPEDIANTHYSQIDANRLPDSVRPYLGVVQQRLQYLEGELARYQQSAAAASATQIQAQLMQNAPKPYTPDEIAAISKQLTAKQISVADPDELDFYDPKVIALQAVNAQRVEQARANEIGEYGKQAQGEMSLRTFYNTLALQ